MGKQQPTCAARIDAHLRGRLADIKILWDEYCEGIEYNEELGTFEEYGLCFDYVPANTFSDQPEGFFRYQLSTGGPGDEFRFFVNPDFTIHRIEYWFLDWYDGASRKLEGQDYAILEEIYTNLFLDCGCAQAEYNKTRETYHDEA